MKQITDYLKHRIEYLENRNTEAIGSRNWVSSSNFESRIDELQKEQAFIKDIPEQNPYKFTDDDIERMADEFCEYKMSINEGFDLCHGWRKNFRQAIQKVNEFYQSKQESK